MEKKIVEIELEFVLDWAYEVVPISKIRADLDEVERIGATHISMDYSTCYELMMILPVCKRLETDQESMDRANDEKLRATAMEIKELAELERLKEKYK